MNHRRTFWAGLVGCFAVTTIAAISWAQTAPGIPGAAGAAAAPAKGNLWSMILPTAEQRQACKNCFCNSMIGKLVGGMAGPMGAATGGMMVNRCEKNKIDQDIKNKPADDPDGLAARVKADEAEAKARRASVRFLGTVDCNYWPEAIDTLKTALRKDRNECVRFEAALALRNGCCCNNEIVDALTQSVLGENKTDPHPVERSDRVRAAAAEALARCPLKEDPKKIDKILTRNSNQNLDPKEYAKKVAQLPREEVTANARAVLASMQQANKAPGANGETPQAPAAPGNAPGLPVVSTVAPRPNSVSGIVSNAFAQPAEPRAPFFANLTKTLTGSQEYVTTARPERMMAMPGGVLQPSEPRMVTPFEAPRPIPVDELPPASPTLPRSLPEVPPAPVSPGPEIISSAPLVEVAPMTIQLAGPQQVVLGKEAVFDVRLVNHSNQTLTGIHLYGWLPEPLSHAAGSEIKGEVDTTVAPGAFAMLRLPATAIKAGRGIVRVKVETNLGEATAAMEIDVAVTAVAAPDAPVKLEFGRPNIDDPANPTSSPANAAKIASPVEIIQSVFHDPNAVRPHGSLGVVSMEDGPPVQFRSPVKSVILPSNR